MWHYSLHHVENCGVEVEPEVVVGDCHGLEGDGLGILEEGVGSPDVLEPRDRQQAVLPRHVLREAQTVVLPTLSEEDVRCVGLSGRKKITCRLDTNLGIL